MTLRSFHTPIWRFASLNHHRDSLTPLTSSSQGFLGLIRSIHKLLDGQKQQVVKDVKQRNHVINEKHTRNKNFELSRLAT